MADKVKSSLNTTGEKAANHVSFGTDAKTPDAKKPVPASQGYVVEVTIPPPVGLQLKDEVELLRGGFKDKEGHQLKSQATAAKQPPAKAAKSNDQMGNDKSCEKSSDSKPVPKKKKAKKETTVEIDF